VEPVELIREALLNRGISVQDEIIDSFRLYQSHLLDWNMKTNLISKNDETRIVTRHFLQSLGLLTVFDFPQESRIFDLGTGGGFPGLPIKIVRSDLDMVLVEATQKKAVFLEEVVKNLKLEKVMIIPKRIESLKNQIKPADFILSRAVADLNLLFRWSKALIKNTGGQLISIKGKGVIQEMQRLKADNRTHGRLSFKILKYNPFPELFVLHDSFIVVIGIE
jgi:16S rRNA (guanine527-N7)-methyltransferase